MRSISAGSSSVGRRGRRSSCRGSRAAARRARASRGRRRRCRRRQRDVLDSEPPLATTRHVQREPDAAVRAAAPPAAHEAVRRGDLVPGLRAQARAPSGRTAPPRRSSRTAAERDVVDPGDVARRRPGGRRSEVGEPARPSARRCGRRTPRSRRARRGERSASSGPRCAAAPGRAAARPAAPSRPGRRSRRRSRRPAAPAGADRGVEQYRAAPCCHSWTGSSGAGRRGGNPGVQQPLAADARPADGELDEGVAASAGGGRQRATRRSPPREQQRAHRVDRHPPRVGLAEDVVEDLERERSRRSRWRARARGTPARSKPPCPGKQR